MARQQYEVTPNTLDDVKLGVKLEEEAGWGRALWSTASGTTTVQFDRKTRFSLNLELFCVLLGAEYKTNLSFSLSRQNVEL